MDKIDISADDAVSLELIAPGLTGLRILFVNVFAVSAPGGWTLVDAGLHGSTARIESWAEESFGGRPPLGIVLTHAHFDHVGALDDLARRWRVPVFAHVEELPYLTGGQSYPPPDPMVGGGMMARMSKLYPRGPFELHEPVQALPGDGTIPGLPGWRWIHMPGHTAGHVSLFRDEDRALIVGDAFCTTKQESFFAVATQRPELHGPPAYFTTDWDAARESVRRLSALHPAVMAPGHGQPMAGEDAMRALEELAERFDEVARPEHGRYTDQPTRR